MYALVIVGCDLVEITLYLLMEEVADSLEKKYRLEKNAFSEIDDLRATNHGDDDPNTREPAHAQLSKKL